MKHRIQKLLSNYGYCSRRKAEELIEQGKVKVNGKVISLGDKASESNTITVGNKPIKKQESIYLMFNKPIHCVTALKDRQHKTVMDYITVKERIFPIGRLDYNTSGLLLLTNDGTFANNIMHPSKEIEKTYEVEISRSFRKRDKEKLEKGIPLEDGKTAPAKIKLLDSMKLQLTIHEGKNRIIRRMFNSLDYNIKSINRIKIGKLSLKNLKEGTYRTLTKKEREMVFK